MFFDRIRVKAQQVLGSFRIARAYWPDTLLTVLPEVPVLQSHVIPHIPAIKHPIHQPEGCFVTAFNNQWKFKNHSAFEKPCFLQTMKHSVNLIMTFVVVKPVLQMPRL